MKLNKIFTLSFYLIVIIFNYGYSYNSFVKDRINLTIQSERYHIIVASFKTESLAQKELVRLNNLGYEFAKILYDENGKNFRISIMSFDKRSSAINYTKELIQSEFNDTWIFYDRTNLNQSSPNQIVKTNVNSNINLQSNSSSKDILPVSQSQDEGDSEYHILVGSFNNENYANNFKESLLRQGYLKAKVIKEAEDTFNVVLDTFTSKVDADKFILTLSDTPYRNATIPGYSSKKSLKVIPPRPIPNQSVSSTLVSTLKPVAKPSNLKKLPLKLQIKSNSTSKDILPVSQSQDEGDSEYHILVGSFNNENYANNFKESLLRQGYLKAKVIKEAEDTFNVVLDTFTSKVDADKFILTLSDTPYRNATIPGYSSKKSSKVIPQRPIPNQSISEQIVLKKPVNPNSSMQSEEVQAQIKDLLEEGKANNVNSEKPTD